MTLSVGILGLGKIGRACAANLIADGFAVTALARPSTSDFPASGGRLAASIAEVVRASDVVITCLASEVQMREVYEAPGGLPAAARPDLVVIEMGTFPAALKRRYADAVGAKGTVMLDCPISGVPATVLARNAILFVSGDEAHAARARPVIDSIAPKSLHVGPFGAGMTTKLAANLLVIVNSMAAAEAMALANKSGLTSPLFMQALLPSAGSSRVLEYRAPLMVERKYRPAMGTAEIALKDLTYIREHARASGAATPLVETALAWFERLVDEGRGDDEMAAIFELLLASGSRGPGQ